MLFTEKIKELRIQNQLPQRKLAETLDIDTATYCKIEKGERNIKKEQVKTLACIYHVDAEELLTLWLADKITDIVSGNETIAPNVLSIAAENISRSNG